MRLLRPEARFLLRGSVLLVCLLILWRFLLLTPLEYLLRCAAGEFLTIQVTPVGDWTLRVPLNRTIPAAAGRPALQRIHSIDFDIPQSDIHSFTFSLPVLWAIVLATPGWRRNLRRLAAGTLLMALLELVMLLVFVHISALNAAAQLESSKDAAGSWARQFGGYLVVNALPFILPLAVAIWVDRELRAQILGWGAEGAAPAAPAMPGRGKRQARRRQA